MNFHEIKNEAKISLVNNRLMFFLAILIVGAITGLTSYFLIGILVAPILSMGLYLLGSDLLEKKGFNIYRVFDLFKDLNHAIKLVGVYFLTALIVIGGLILLVIPGIIFAYQYSQASYIMVENPELGIWDAMKKSKEMMKGFKMDFFVFQLSFIGHIILIALTFGLYGIYIIPYIQLSMFNYYKRLNKLQNPRPKQIILDL